MQKEKIDQFIMVNGDKFPPMMIEQSQDVQLQQADDAVLSSCKK